MGLSCGPRDGVQVHYHTALSLNPHNEDGRRGLERLEKLLKGIRKLQAARASDFLLTKADLAHPLDSCCLRAIDTMCAWIRSEVGRG